MRTISVKRMAAAMLAWVLSFPLFLCGPALAQSGGTLEVTLGKSVVVETEVPITRASLANPAVADAVVLSPRQIYVTGTGVGGTNLTLWQSEEEVYRLYNISVQPDVSELKEQIYQLFPEETGVRVTTSREHIAVSGTVSSAPRLSHVLSVAEAYAPGKVVNLLQVGGVQQVMLEVRVAEMNRELVRRLGINVGYANEAGQGFVTTIGELGATVAEAATTGGYGLVPVAANALVRFSQGGDQWTVLLDALKENGLAKILAEPTLVALSGQEANFLAGGEFPIPVPQGFGTVSITYKKFGVGLSFTPVVLGGNVISIKVAPEVSELDFTNAVVLNGFLIPAITTRRAATVLELRDGQSFAVAGLIRSSVREKLSKYPMLGELPILGSLFRSSQFLRNETELIILVTPRLVKPIEGESVRVPTDDFVEPNDLDFFGFGKLEKIASTPEPMAVDDGDLGGAEAPEPTPAPAASPARASRPVSGPRPGLDGEFGHVNP